MGSRRHWTVCLVVALSTVGTGIASCAPSYSFGEGGGEGGMTPSDAAGPADSAVSDASPFATTDGGDPGSAAGPWQSVLFALGVATCPGTFAASPVVWPGRCEACTCAGGAQCASALAGYSSGQHCMGTPVSTLSAPLPLPAGCSQIQGNGFGFAAGMVYQASLGSEAAACTGTSSETPPAAGLLCTQTCDGGCAPEPPPPPFAACLVRPFVGSAGCPSGYSHWAIVGSSVADNGPCACSCSASSAACVGSADAIEFSSDVTCTAPIPFGLTSPTSYLGFGWCKALNAPPATARSYKAWGYSVNGPACVASGPVSGGHTALDPQLLCCP